MACLGFRPFYPGERSSKPAGGAPRRRRVRFPSASADLRGHCGDLVFAHGDLHAYNQVWDQQRRRLRLVADFETSGAAEAEYDLRYIPALGPGVGLLISTAEHYGKRTGTPLNFDHVMAWHLGSYLGEALWRSEAGLPLLLPLPGGGTASDYVNQLSERFGMLRFTP